MIEPFFPFFLFRQLCLYISHSLHLFTLFLTDSLEKCQTKRFENEYSTFCNFQILYHKSALQNCSTVCTPPQIHIPWPTLQCILFFLVTLSIEHSNLQSTLLQAAALTTTKHHTFATRVIVGNTSISIHMNDGNEAA